MLTIVTACDERYARCANQLLRSAAHHGQHERHRFVCYDLGMSAATRRQLEARWPFCRFVTFDFTHLPPHAALAERTYAWKPFVIADAARAGGHVLWLDSATILQTPDLTPVTARLTRHGTYTLRGFKSLWTGCDRRVLERLACPKELWLERIHVSGVVGLDVDDGRVREVLDAWCEAARDPACNYPPGPAHSADQSLLSIVLHKAKLDLNDEEIDISSFRPARWLTSRNKLPLWLPRSLEPLARLYYAIYKRADRVVLRGKDWHRRQLSGMHRALREHYTVYLDGRPLRAPAFSYYADPFLLQHEGRVWLYVEQFLYRENRGRLLAMPADAPAQTYVVLDLPAHVSFPHVFRFGDALYLLPETSAQRTIDVYACDAPPQRFSLRKRLLAGIDAADSVMLAHEGRVYLVTSVREGDGERALAIFSADHPLADEWEPHPINRERRFAEASFGYGRNAGRMTARGRVMHTSVGYYGESIAPMDIEVLTRERFIERPASSAVPPFAHHYDREGAHEVWDVRERF